MLPNSNVGIFLWVSFNIFGIHSDCLLLPLLRLHCAGVIIIGIVSTTSLISKISMAAKDICCWMASMDFWWPQFVVGFNVGGFSGGKRYLLKDGFVRISNKALVSAPLVTVQLKWLTSNSFKLIYWIISHEIKPENGQLQWVQQDKFVWIWCPVLLLLHVKVIPKRSIQLRFHQDFLSRQIWKWDNSKRLTQFFHEAMFLLAICFNNIHHKFTKLTIQIQNCSPMKLNCVFLKPSECLFQLLPKI